MLKFREGDDILKKHLVLLSLPLIIVSVTSPSNYYGNTQQPVIKNKSVVLPPNPSHSGVNADGLIMTTKLNKENYKGKSLLVEYATEKYRSGLLENYFNYKINQITEVNGVYSHFNNYVSKSLLVSGNYSAGYKETVKYYTCSSETLFFEYKVSSNFEILLSTAFSLSTANLNNKNVAEYETSIKYEYNYRNSTRETIEKQSTVSFNIDSNMVQYCPDNYSITIGTVAQYYIINLSYRNVVKYWWGDKKDSFKNVTIMAVNESTLFDTFVYRYNIADVQTTYYLP